MSDKIKSTRLSNLVNLLALPETGTALRPGSNEHTATSNFAPDGLSAASLGFTILPQTGTTASHSPRSSASPSLPLGTDGAAADDASRVEAGVSVPGRGAYQPPKFPASAARSDVFGADGGSSGDAILAAQVLRFTVTADGTADLWHRPDPVSPGSADTAGSGSVASAAAGAATSPPLSVSFAGKNYDSNKTQAPGTSIAAGDSYIITVENARIQWYGKTGQMQYDNSLFSFFGLNAKGGDLIADVQTVYDNINDRYIVMVDEGIKGKNYIGFAVSKTSNPNDGWNFSQINSTIYINGKPCWADFPRIATDGDAIYMSAQMRTYEPYGFPNFKDPFQENHLWIIKDGIGTGGLYDGGPAQILDFRAATVTGNSSYVYYGRPVQMLDPASGSLGAFLVNPTLPNGTIGVIRIDNLTTSPTFQMQNLAGTVATESSRVLAKQPGTTLQLDSQTMGNAVWQNGMLYVCSVAMPTSGPDTGVPTVFWEKIDTSNLAALKIVDSGTISGSLLGAGVATYLPSISADDNGDFIINFTASGPSLYAGAYYAVHTAADAPGTIRTPQPLHVGMDVYALTDKSGNVRWGCDSGAALDPLAQNTFWIFNQYAAPRGSGQTGNWATQIGSVVAPQTVGLQASLTTEPNLATGFDDIAPPSAGQAASAMSDGVDIASPGTSSSDAAMLTLYQLGAMPLDANSLTG